MKLVIGIAFAGITGSSVIGFLVNAMTSIQSELNNIGIG